MQRGKPPRALRPAPACTTASFGARVHNTTEESTRSRPVCILVFMFTLLMRMIMSHGGRRSLRFRLLQRFCFGNNYLFATVLARGLIKAMREAELAALLIYKHVRTHERVVRPAIFSMTLRVAHSN